MQLSLAGGKASGDGDSQSPTGGKGPGVFIHLIIYTSIILVQLPLAGENAPGDSNSQSSTWAQRPGHVIPFFEDEDLGRILDA